MTDEEKAELKQLKELATSLGISYSPNIGLETLRNKIKAVQEKQDTGTLIQTKKEESIPETEAQKRRKKIKELTALVRVQIVNQDPSETDLPGMFVVTSNDLLPKIGRYIPTKGETTHVERILLNTLKEMHFVRHSKRDNKEGGAPVTTLVPKFVITELPPLTETELKELAKMQQAGNHIDNESN